MEGGWYHVTVRGIERRAIFKDKRDHGHFLELLEEMSERYGVEVHAYALMGNHYHLLLRTPRANASVALQWLNVSYSVWFNKKRERAGHVFQGQKQHRFAFGSLAAVRGLAHPGYRDPLADAFSGLQGGNRHRTPSGVPHRPDHRRGDGQD